MSIVSFFIVLVFKEFLINEKKKQKEKQGENRQKN